MEQSAQRRVPIESQRVDAPLTSSAVLLTLTLTDPAAGSEAVRIVRGVLADLEDITKNVAFRDLDAALACTVGIGSDVWDAVTGAARPAELHPFREVVGAVHTAPSTPGDLFVHIRANRRDLCFELERQLLDRLHGAVLVTDETVGFRYFDARDLLGFVDGTANPVGDALPAATLVDASDPAADPAARGGSYLVAQKYVHSLAAWNRMSVEQQEAVIGRTKLDNIELADASASEQKSHKTLSTITDDDGVEHDILRDNMPFGSPGHGEFGTYFIGYTARLWVIERMLERMFLGDPPGKHDRLLDASTALTGGVFFVPPAGLLAGLGD